MKYQQTCILILIPYSLPDHYNKIIPAFLNKSVASKLKVSLSHVCGQYLGSGKRKKGSLII